MSNTVYLVRDEGELIKKILTEKGYEVIVGDGVIHESMVKNANALVPGKAYITRDVIKMAPELKIVSKFGVGMDRTDIKACTELGVYAANTPLANYVSVAEHAVMLMMVCAKKVYQISQYLRHEYPDWDAARRYQAYELCGKTLSLIGLGNIGRYVAKLAHGFGMKIVGYDPYADKEKLPDYIELADTMDEAFKCADFVSVHVAGTDSTRNLIGIHEFSLMKPTAIFINTTRGFVVNEDALIAALRNGVIAGAGLDVFKDEPLKKGNPLMFMENVVATPHNAANTADARLRAEADCAQNIIDVFEGRRPKYALNDPVK